VIFNPEAGRRRARERLEAISAGWNSKAEFWPTERTGHAVELGRRASERGFAVVAAAGGDGTIHEVANGLLHSGREDVCFAVLPLGSADDYAYSLKHDQKAPGLASSRGRNVDVGVVRTDRGDDRYFVCCLGLGLSACVTVEAQRIRWLQGQLLYGLAALKAILLHWGYVDLTATLDGELVPMGLTLTLSVMIGRREGGFLLAPQAQLDDGLFELIHAGQLTQWEAIRFIPSLSKTGPSADHPKLGFHQGRRLLIESRQSLISHTDGEMLCLPEDKVRRVEIELLPRRLMVRLGLDGMEE
jgi:diacylglycerol kinase family enzyme